MANLKSARSVETVTDVGYHRCDTGLYLQVASGGTKSWLFRYKSPVTAKQREMGLGALSLVFLAQARNRAIESPKQMLAGLDHLEERDQQERAQLLQQARTITFRDAAEQCIASKKQSGRIRNTASSGLTRLKPMHILYLVIYRSQYLILILY